MSDYPHKAGHRGVDTSIAGADLIAEKLPLLQASVLGVIVAAGERGATGDEIAALLGWERHRVRPRTSELRNMRRIGDSGHRRPSDLGIASIVWISAEHLDRGVAPCR
jgi:hypothetical protein